MIDKFEGEYAFLSNFYNSPFVINGIEYPTVEHFFQAQKATSMVERRNIAAATTPGQAKRMGRQVYLRPGWEEIKDEKMMEGLRAKFSDPELRKKLLATGDELLEEGNWWHDNYWGVCHCVHCQDKRALNHLGKALMALRDELKNN